MSEAGVRVPTVRAPSIITLLLSAAVLACGGERTAIPLDGSLPRAPEAAEMESALLASGEAWNATNLDGFMAPYLRSTDLTFSGSAGVRRGFGAVMERYRTNYFEADEPLPGLRFEDLETRDLGRDHALMLGRYVLLDPATGAETGTGFFSLVWVRTRDGWRIMHDHTSAAED